ncbi:unnamed protein product [Paramecium primaurelia]|uniref:V-type proton ATPase subunit G n=2 Tax=Paramecium TaxID=5884 RepID=A0A8S1KT81_PARPR|nr:unnamed protein product [Paramecium primaurelia]CAD8153103.1 unnamed protein product [Paramecium pentaurelia]CAD8058609.1 unnamed protein product [Paramecium primaurelia]CAD8067570.1 unnamed protein product [Paramecium primaurelia]CAD8067574.1 unnamed protein product [Paramecium primaurelia]
MAEGRENWAVDELLKAEEEANNIIKTAQKEREKKIKEAKVAADQEIAVFRREEETRYNQEILRRFGSTKEEEELERKTKAEIDKIYLDYEANKLAVVDMLIKRVIEVKLEVPRVVKGQFEQPQQNL